jgi:exocyst complex protein 7
MALNPAFQARLLETGAKKLVQMYTKLVAEASSGPTPAPGTDLTVAPFSATLRSSIQPLVAFLRTLPLPASHPSHPAALAIFSTLKEAQRGYADMRGSWSKKCLEAQGSRVIDRADSLDPVVSGREVGKWTESLLSVADVRPLFCYIRQTHDINLQEEYNLLADLAPLPTPSLLASTFSTLLAPLLSLFSDTISSLVSLVKRSLHKYTFLALSAYESLLALQPLWDNLLARRGLEGTRKEKEGTEIKDTMYALRQVCMRSFPEALADVKIAVMGKSGESTGVAEIVILVRLHFPVLPGNGDTEALRSVPDVQTAKFLERIPEVQAGVGSALLSLGDGNWKMGEGVQVGIPTKLGDGDEQIIIEHFTCVFCVFLSRSWISCSQTQ